MPPPLHKRRPIAATMVAATMAPFDEMRFAMHRAMLPAHVVSLVTEHIRLTEPLLSNQYARYY
jgi:hypothetical protein